MKDYGSAPGSCNDYLDNGIRFIYGGNAEDYPISYPYGVLVSNKTYHPNLDTTYYSQIYYASDSRGVYSRFKQGDNNWESWQRLDNFGYNTLEELAAALKPLLGL